MVEWAHSIEVRIVILGFFAKFGHSLCYYAFMMLAYEKVRRMLKYVMLRALKAA